MHRHGHRVCPPERRSPGCCVGHESLEVGANLFDHFIDERFFARELFQRRFEVAFAKFGHTGHGFFLDIDVPKDHIVDALGHNAIGAVEFLGRDGYINIAEMCCSDMWFISFCKVCKTVATLLTATFIFS